MPTQPDRWYPVVLEATRYRIVLAPGDTLADAVQRAQDRDVYGLWDDAEPADEYSGIEVASNPIARMVIESSTMWDDPIGPAERCPECGAIARDATPRALRNADHLRGCSRFLHRIERAAAWTAPAGNGWERVGWYLACSCQAPGLEYTTNARTVADFPGRTIYDDGPAIMAAACAHIDGRPHTIHVPLGVTEEADHPNYRAVPAPAEAMR